MSIMRICILACLSIVLLVSCAAPTGTVTTLATESPATPPAANSTPPVTATAQEAESPAVSSTVNPSPATEATPDAAAQVHPIVYDGYLLGGWYGGMWQEPADTAAHIQGGESYRLYSFDGYLCEGTGGTVAPDSHEEPYAETVVIRPDMPDKLTDELFLALSTDWEPQPRKTAVLDNCNDDYRKAVEVVLAEMGFPDAEPSVTQVLKADLEGDGIDEVFIYAQSILPADELASVWQRSGESFFVSELTPYVNQERDNYSLLFMRKLVSGQVKNVIFSWEFYPSGEASQNLCPMVYRMEQLADLNGDGTMEVIVAWRYYEGDGYCVFEVKGDQVNVALSNGYVI